MIPLDKIRALPQTLTITIPTDYLDEMGHMNVQYYMALFDRAVWGIFRLFGVDFEKMAAMQSGAFAIEQHIRYLAEVHVGEQVSIHSRLIERSPKRLKFMHFMVNQTTDTLACTIEILAMHIDMRQRRSAPWPPEYAPQIDRMIALHNDLDWPPPLSGCLSV